MEGTTREVYVIENRLEFTHLYRSAREGSIEHNLVRVATENHMREFETYEDALMVLFADKILAPDARYRDSRTPRIVRKRITTYEPTVEVLPLERGEDL